MIYSEYPLIMVLCELQLQIICHFGFQRLIQLRDILVYGQCMTNSLMSKEGLT